MTDSSQLSIRPATQADIPALVRLWFDTWHVTSPELTHPEPIERWEGRFSTEVFPSETVLVAEREGRVAGFMALREKDSYLHLLYVSPEAQGHGVGSRFLAEAARRCPRGLRLSTLESNTNARRFYERHGWTEGEHGRLTRTGFPSVSYHWTPLETNR